MPRRAAAPCLSANGASESDWPVSCVLGPAGRPAPGVLSVQGEGYGGVCGNGAAVESAECAASSDCEDLSGAVSDGGREDYFGGGDGVGPGGCVSESEQLGVLVFL